MTYKKLSATTSGNNVLVEGETDKQIVVYSIFFQTGTAVTVVLRSGTTDMTGSMPFVSNGGLNLSNHGAPLFTCGVNEDLIMHLSGLLLPSCGGGLIYDIVGI